MRAKYLEFLDFLDKRHIKTYSNANCMTEVRLNFNKKFYCLVTYIYVTSNQMFFGYEE